MEHAAIGTALVSLEGRCLYGNAALRQLFGYEQDELVRLSIADLTHPDDLEADLSQIRDLIEGNIQSYRMEKRYIRKDRTLVWAELSVALVRRADGAPDYLIAQAQDISERLKNEAALVEARNKAEAAAAAESEFLANMTHELRTPLNAIVGFAGILARSSRLAPADASHAARIVDASKVLLDLVNDVLDFSRLDGTAIELERATFDPDELARAVAALMAGQATGKCLELSARFEGELAPLLGDATRVRQVLTNFVANALKFTMRGAVRITVTQASAGAGSSFLRMAVSDTGIGIESDKIGRLFDRFTQADASTSRRYGGTGLGLAISKKIVELMGGRIGCDSRPGEGSTFWFEVVLPTADALPSERPAESMPSLPATPLRLLLVEDVAVNRELITVLLTPFQIEIETAENGQQAVDAVRSRDFDVVLMDVQMPVMGGLEAARAIRALRSPVAQSLPIIAMTANVLPDQVQKCLEAGRDDHIGKPIDPAALLAALNHWSTGRHVGARAPGAAA